MHGVNLSMSTGFLASVALLTLKPFSPEQVRSLFPVGFTRHLRTNADGTAPGEWPRHPYRVEREYMRCLGRLNTTFEST